MGEAKEEMEMTDRQFIVFVNTRSGGQLGAVLVKKFKERGVRAVDIFATKPDDWLASTSAEEVGRLKILVAGGDGTVRWIMDALERARLPIVPPIATLPLGTGNDFARVTGWGSHYHGQCKTPQRTQRLVDQVMAAEPVNYDRWTVTRTLGTQTIEESMVNYFSIGIDAKVANGFHKLRHKRPGLFISPLTNKCIYFCLGSSSACSCDPSVRQLYRLKVDGKDVQIPASCRGLVVLNVNSYGGGMKLWNPPKKSDLSESATSDGKLEVVGVKSTLHIGLIRVKLGSAQRIAQGSDISITPIGTSDVHVNYQIDGEPWDSEPATITIQHRNTTPVLFRPRQKSRLV